MGILTPFLSNRHHRTNGVARHPRPRPLWWTPAYGHEGAAVNDGDGALAAQAQGRKFGPLGTALVIIPTYNEAENIKSIVGRVRQSVPEAHVLVADDNSPDGTGKLPDELAAEDEQVQGLDRKGKEGLGPGWVPGGRVVNWPKSREFISRGGSLYSRVALDLPLRDITGGSRAFRRE